MKFVFDIESNGLDYKAPDFKIHCVCIHYIYDNPNEFHKINNEAVFSDKHIFNVHDAVEELNKADLIIGHNIQSYDIPALEYYTKKSIKAKPFDTLVMSRLMFPLQDGHSLGDWGERLGISKKTAFEYKDFSTLTNEMIEQCQQDVRITKKLYDHLIAQNWSQDSIDLETEVATIIQKQVDRGFKFDEEKAQELYAKLAQKRNEMTQSLRSLFPPFIKPNDKRKTPKPIEFNPGSTDHIIYCLKRKYNWQPKKFTKKGKPCMDEDVLASLEYPEAKELSEYAQVKKIIGMLAEGEQAWLKLVKNGRIHGEVLTTGAITGRMKHRSPNTTQVPRVTSYLGTECRSLFTASQGMVLVGVDASGLEARTGAHYLFPYDNGELKNRVLTGNVHSENAKIIYAKENITSAERTVAKTTFFAYIFQAQAPRIAEINNISLKEATELKETLDSRFPTIQLLHNAVREKSKKGFLWGLDGRRIYLRKTQSKKTGKWYYNSPVNSLCQSAGAIIMKRAIVVAHSIKPDIRFVQNSHDEIQTECYPHEVEEIKTLLIESIKKAGEYYQFLCPLDAEAKVGKNWAETH